MAVTQDSRAVVWAYPPLHEDREIVLTAVTKNNLALERIVSHANLRVSSRRVNDAGHPEDVASRFGSAPAPAVGVEQRFAFWSTV